ncbi:hypothetical protein SeMB42_g04360 [Synchytrium endobioticum]|uniref:Uncharacterized protein n=1 Tax=Synchytrium endobioticum TaxID=286115 RepID=A0A507CYY9_9FUNG|nr:hypothetical protein SeMB42_g04360 [Synchytrium endobioticum]
MLSTERSSRRINVFKGGHHLELLAYCAVLPAPFKDLLGGALDLVRHWGLWRHDDSFGFLFHVPVTTGVYTGTESLFPGYASKCAKITNYFCRALD